MSAGEKDGGLQKRTDREAGEETQCAVCLCVCVCVFFLLIQIRFHKDPHDCLITTGMQKGMRWRDEASRDMKKLINSCLPFAQLLSLFFPECFSPLVSFI